MSDFIDRTGERVGETLIVRRDSNVGKRVMWVCRCGCGNIFSTRYEHLLRNSNCPKCGRKAQAEKISKHGKYQTPLYKVWISMKQRCYNPESKSYKDYGGRGIKICREWKESYPAFEKWANENGYKNGLSIDRINNDRGYSPNNCRWTDSITQANNKRNVTLITFNGDTDTISNMARKYGLRPCVVTRRLYRSWTVEKALTTPLQTQMIHR